MEDVYAYLLNYPGDLQDSGDSMCNFLLVLKEWFAKETVYDEMVSYVESLEADYKKLKDFISDMPDITNNEN